MVGMDADYLSLLLHPNPRAPNDPSTEKPVPKTKEKVEFLIETLEKMREKIIVPTPALSEVLCIGIDKASDYLAEINSNHVFEVAPFDEAAGVEAAIATAQARAAGDKRGGSKATWAKVKFDRQIV